VAVGVAEAGALVAGALLAGALLAGVLLLGAAVAGAVPAAGELLAALGVAVALVAGVVVATLAVLADGVGDGLTGVALLTAPPPRVVPWPGLPWTTADSGLPAAPSTRVTATAQLMNAAPMIAAGPAQRGRRRDRPCRPPPGTTVVS
jgi:hypothetical protein